MIDHESRPVNDAAVNAARRNVHSRIDPFDPFNPKGLESRQIKSSKRAERNLLNIFKLYSQQDTQRGVRVLVPGTENYSEFLEIARSMAEERREGNDLLRKAIEFKNEGHTDEVTGLLNRKGFNDALYRTRGLFRREQFNPASVVVQIDLDKLKIINDKTAGGHAAGDEALKILAAILKKSLRSTDIAARIGGDEFLVVMPDCDPYNATMVMLDFANNLALHGYRKKGNAKDTPLTASVGIVGFNIIDELTTKDLIRIVDPVLYLSKEKRNAITTMHQDKTLMIQRRKNGKKIK